MTIFVLVLAIALLTACGGGKEAGSDQVRFDVAIDTEMINPGQEILFLNAGLSQSQLSKDKKYLYNFNHTDFSIEKINLDELKFEEKITFSKEGPNGVGQYFMGFVLIDVNPCCLDVIIRTISWTGAVTRSGSLTSRK